MTPSQLWLITAIVLFILEVITPGFVLANFGVAAIAAAITAWLGGDVTIQMIVFVLTCLASFVTIRPLLSRTVGKQKVTRTGVDAIIGRLTKVTEAIDSPLDAGRVQIDGDSWRALSVHGQSISLGTTVRVVRVDGTTVYVEQI